MEQKAVRRPAQEAPGLALDKADKQRSPPQAGDAPQAGRPGVPRPGTMLANEEMSALFGVPFGAAYAQAARTSAL